MGEVLSIGFQSCSLVVSTMQREIKVGQVWKYSTMNSVDKIIEWIFVVIETLGPNYSNVKVMLLDTPYKSSGVGCLQHYLIDADIQWQLLFDV